MDFTIEVKGDEDIRRKLAAVKSGISDMYGTFKTLGQNMKEYYSDIPFRSRGSVFGRPWQELSPGYKSWKADNYPGRPLMVLTGKLQNSYDFTATRNQVRLVNTADYFGKHQKGQGVPQRVLMALTRERADAAKEIIAKDIKKKVEKA